MVRLGQNECWDDLEWETAGKLFARAGGSASLESDRAFVGKHGRDREGEFD
jgi:hypothetical protein